MCPITRPLLQFLNTEYSMVNACQQYAQPTICTNTYWTSAIALLVR